MEVKAVFAVLAILAIFNASAQSENAEPNKAALAGKIQIVVNSEGGSEVITNGIEVIFLSVTGDRPPGVEVLISKDNCARTITGDDGFYFIKDLHQGMNYQIRKVTANIQGRQVSFEPQHVMSQEPVVINGVSVMWHNAVLQYSEKTGFDGIHNFNAVMSAEDEARVRQMMDTSASSGK